MNRWFEFVRGVRALRAEAGVTPKESLPALMFEGDLDGASDIILSQAWFQTLEAGKGGDEVISTTVAGVDFHLSTAGLVDVEKEVARLTKELEKTEDERQKLMRQLDNPQFVERAKPEVVEKLRTNLTEIESRLAKTDERLHKMRS